MRSLELFFLVMNELNNLVSSISLIIQNVVGFLLFVARGEMLFSPRASIVLISVQSLIMASLFHLLLFSSLSSLSSLVVRQPRRSQSAQF